MRNRLSILAIFVLLAFLTATGPAFPGAATDPVAIINHAREVVKTPNPPDHGLTQVLADVLEASLAILPRTDYAPEFRKGVESAKKAFSAGDLFSEKTYQDLGKAYELVSGGKAWEIPEELKAPGHGSIDDARKVCLKRLDAALAEHQAGRNVDAARDLVGFVILVVTPIQK